MDKKSMQKSIKNLMHLGIDFWKDFGGFWEAKWNQVGTKIDQKSMPIAKSDFLKNRALAPVICACLSRSYRGLAGSPRASRAERGRSERMRIEKIGSSGES